VRGGGRGAGARPALKIQRARGGAPGGGGFDSHPPPPYFQGLLLLER